MTLMTSDSKFRVVENNVNVETVSILEAVLAKAKSGEVLMVVIGTLNKANEATTIFNGDIQLRDGLLLATVIRCRLEAAIAANIVV